MGNNPSQKITEDKTVKQNPQKHDLQKRRQRLISERLHELEKQDRQEHFNHEEKPKRRMPSILTRAEKLALETDPRKESYPFENLVFEGGGTKGLAYCGVIRAFEEYGLMKNIKRFAGASSGSITAALLSVGYTSKELEEFFSQDLAYLFLDASWGYLSLLPNLLKGYGWNPLQRFFKVLGDVLAKKTGDPDVTFLEVYQKFGNELCVVVCNVNYMTETYCHPKTTPHMPIRLAVRMSASLPGLFQAATYTLNGETNTFVDGGVLCNYPIHSFDGWWLSMKPGDNFLRKLQPMERMPLLLHRSERFGEYNDKTLGFLLYGMSERDLFKFQLEQRIAMNCGELPDTCIARKKKKQIQFEKLVSTEHRRVTIAVNEFLKVLQKHDLDHGGAINKTELTEAFKDEEFSKESEFILFGENCTIDQALQTLDTDHNGKIEYVELIHFIESTGVFLMQRFLGYRRKEITGLKSFFGTLQNTLLINEKRIFATERDLNRTVGINTGHIGTEDFNLENDDMQFLFQQGYDSVVTYLKYYAANQKLTPEEQKENVSDHENEESADGDDDKTDGI